MVRLLQYHDRNDPDEWLLDLAFASLLGFLTMVKSQLYQDG